MYREMSARESARSAAEELQKSQKTSEELKKFVEMDSQTEPTPDDRFPSDSEEEQDSDEDDAFRIVPKNPKSHPTPEDASEAASDAEDHSDTDNTIIMVPGSVLSSYLSDPITNPSATYLFESPRPRAADFVYLDKYSRLGSVPAYSSTTTFIQLLNEISEQEPDECQCSVFVFC